MGTPIPHRWNGWSWHLDQLARAVSRLLNALTLGEGDTTFSAGSWALKLAGSRLGHWRVAVIDRLHPGDPDHCRKAWEWHRDRGLLQPDTSRLD